MPVPDDELAPEHYDPPTRPKNLRLGYVEAYKAYVRWTDASTTEKWFRLQWRRPEGYVDVPKYHGGGWKTSHSRATTGTTYGEYVENLSPDRTTCYRVVAMTEAYAFSRSKKLCVHTRRPPAPPSDLEVEQVTPTTISVSWKDNSFNEDKFLVRWYASTGARQVYVGANRTTHTITDLTPGEEWCVVVWSFQENVGHSLGRVEVCDINTPQYPDEPQPGLKADVDVVGGLWVMPSLVDSGKPFTLSWRVCNTGAQATGEFRNVAQLDGGPTYSRTVTSLSPGECSLQIVNHSGLSHGNHDWYVYLDADGEVDEANEANNIHYYSQEVL